MSWPSTEHRTNTFSFGTSSSWTGIDWLVGFENEAVFLVMVPNVSVVDSAPAVLAMARPPPTTAAEMAAMVASLRIVVSSFTCPAGVSGSVRVHPGV